VLKPLATLLLQASFWAWLISKAAPACCWGR
jgi:hypothetical protein